MNDDFFDFRLQQLRDKYPSLKCLQDYHLFTILCLKYYYFSDATTPFDADLVLNMLTDGANDGGVDAILLDPTDDSNDLIIVQSKYYGSSKVTADGIISELTKISATVENLDNHKVASYNEKVVTAFRNGMEDKEDDGKIRIMFFTSYQTKNKKEKNRIEKMCKNFFKHYEFDLVFRDDIQGQIETCDNGKLCVEQDKLLMDAVDNYLEYNGSVIVNISAQSLQNLQNRRRNGLLGLNLRYYVRKKEVDDAIKDTISKSPETFWFKNNGILIVCEDYQMDGRVLKLTNFSIVNGGQTTNRIGNLDIEKDFYLQCKVVKVEGANQTEKDKFVNEIAKATNSQKPIKKADLRANAPEQLRLRSRLMTKGVYYITKKGDSVPKQFSEYPYNTASLEQVGKVSLAGVLQMPGSSRSSSQKMHSDNYYHYIFGESAKEGVIADLLKISWYYDQFVKTQIKDHGYDEETVIPVLKNGKTFQMACICFLAKVINGTFTVDEVKGLYNNADEIKVVLRRMDNFDSIIKNKFDNEKELFFEIFDGIGEDVLGDCFGNALEKAKEEQKSLAASDYLKLDNNYYKYVIKRLWSMYNKKKWAKTLNKLLEKQD